MSEPATDSNPEENSENESKPESKPKPKIAVTMGDPAGIGPEICLIALQNPDVLEVCTPIVFGDAGVLVRCADEVMLEPPEHVIPINEWNENHEFFEKPAIVDVGAMEQHEIDHVHAGMADETSGRASYSYITHAIKAALDGQVQGIATAPINKEAWRSAGVQFPGHTEVFAEKFSAEKSCMMLTSEPLTCSFVTVHVGYAEVPDLLSAERILEVIELTNDALKRAKGIAEPKLVVCGLNPHAGENGLFGNGEEEKFIKPAIEQAKAKGIERIEGPVPPDTAFLEPKRKQTDAFICMYHDQGHIPLKALAFDEAINTTLGLKIPRTSVDHGTALDIAWQGKANPNSLFQAIILAAKLAEQEEEDPPAV